MNNYWLKNYQKISAGRQHDQGFALPLVMGMGLVMLLVTATLLHRAQSNQVSAALQARSDRALSAAEIGIARVQSYLNQNRSLATRNLADWPPILASLSQEFGSCPAVQEMTALGQKYAEGQWLPTNVGTADRQQQYRVVGYTYRSQPDRQGQVGVATLTVVGQVNAGLRPATSRLVVEIPISFPTNAQGVNLQSPPPALWVKSLRMSRNAKISGNVRVNTCADLAAHIAGDNWALDGEGRPRGSLARAVHPFFPQLQPIPATAKSLPAIKTSITLPRPGDLPDASGNFHYVVESDLWDNSIQLPDEQQIVIQVAADQSVSLYTQGNIDLGGGRVTVTTIHDGQSHPEKLRIYGSDRTRKFSIKDSASIAAFIHAPQAIGLAIPAAATGAGIVGGLWLQHWDTASHNSQLAIKQQGTWSEFGILPEAQLGLRLQPLSSWQRQEQP